MTYQGSRPVPARRGPTRPRPLRRGNGPLFRAIRIIAVVAAGCLFAWYGQWEVARWYLKVVPTWVSEALGEYEYPLFLGALALAGSLISVAIMQGGAPLWRWGSVRYAAATPTTRFVSIIVLVTVTLTLASLFVVSLTPP